MQTYICCVCSKPHTRRPGNQYKVQYRGKTLYFCGYNCNMKFMRLKESKNHEAIQEMLDCMNS